MAHANAAVVCVHIYTGEYWQLAEKSSQYGVTPYELYDTIMDLSLKWGIRVIGIEDAGYQRSLIHIANFENARRGYIGFQFVPLKTNNASKTSRIITWISMIRKGLYRFSIENFDIYEQINKYDINAKDNEDDEIDCCAYIAQMITTYLHLITAIHVDEMNTQVQSRITNHYR
jgi:hypothetical protein